MKESSKAMRRREADTTFSWREIFKGQVLDVGSGDDPLVFGGSANDAPVQVTHFDLPDGGGDDLTKFFPVALFDTITGSQVLEHMSDPVVALNSWLALLKPGGYIVATVPSWELYEKMRWPSVFNHGHRSTWSLYAKGSPATIHCKLPEWLEQFQVKVLRCALVDSNFDYSKPASVDQTYDASANVECFCEFVLEKP